MLALGMVIPVLPALIREFSGGDTVVAARTLAGSTRCRRGAILRVARGGALSDRFGGGPSCCSPISGWAPTTSSWRSPRQAGCWWARHLGSPRRPCPPGHAYIADITPRTRAKAFGLMGAFGIGFVVGPAGSILGHYDPRLPFWVAGGFSHDELPVRPDRAAGIAAGRARRGTFHGSAPTDQVGGAVAVGCAPAVVRRDALSLQPGARVAASVFVLYTGYRCGWNTQQVGYVLAAVGVGRDRGRTGRSNRLYDRRRRALILAVPGAAGFTALGWRRPGRSIVGIPIMGLWGLCGPSSRAS